jgi:neutral ceramidase
VRRWGLLLVLLLPSGRVGGEELRAGAAKADITPPLGIPLWGYASRRDAPSKGVLEPLHARALVLAVGNEKTALVSLDLGRAPTRQVTTSIRRRLKKEAGIDYFFLVASHTHHGPVLELENWPDAKKPYVRELEHKLTQVILDAARHLKPAQLGISVKEVSLNRNRHSKRPDRPIDRELTVVRIEDTEGNSIAHLINFAAHPTMLSAKLHEFSPDFPGPLAELVEKELGGQCLFLQGAAGDLSSNPGVETGPEKFGPALGRQVVEMAKGLRCTVADTSLRIRTHDFHCRSRIDLSNPLTRTAVSMAFFKDLVDFYEREYREGVRPHLTTALLDGRIGIVGVSGEFFCGHSMSLKKRARLDHLLFLGYCNDYQQYFPTIEAAAEGGYGTDPWVAPAAIGSGERIMDQALIDLYEMRDKRKK